MNTDDWETYMVSPKFVKAKQMTEGGMVSTNRIPEDPAHIPLLENYQPGDWVVRTPNGMMRVWTNEEFKKNYQATR